LTERSNKEDAVSNELNLQGSVALVTGANRGIGLALVEELLERGAQRIYAAARKPESLAGLVARSSGAVTPLRLDITDQKEVQQAATEATDVDLLINNAAIVAHMFAGVDDAAWLEAAPREYETNVIGSLRLMQAFAPILCRNGGGALVNISSVAGLVGMPMVLTYGSTKAALHSLTQSARVLLQGQGTRVVGVYPGPVDTDMAAQLSIPKASAQSVAQAILDGLEQGQEDIYPDPMAKEWGEAYAVNPKSLEGRVAAMTAALD
jgi:NAD(P)-dependent dehydrogenase (short-subunit alcohol dehydrogenase family)